MPAPDSILQLVERFSAQRSAYKSGKYNETQLRRDFLDPFFEALGWDMSNRGDKPERLREVVYESSVDAESQVRADYAFRLGSEIVFFVEAKKPSVNIEYNPQPAFQLRSYGWSARLPISILTDFEEFAIYDCTRKPKHGEPASVGRVGLYSYRDFPEKWDEIQARFSRSAVYSGAFEQFAQSSSSKRGTTDVDDAFLEEMERWREELARNIALRNPGLSNRELNTAVQTTIDRIIFLRICEDRGIEPQDALRNATDGKDVYADLVELFKKADKRYNSGLFHFSAEKGQSSPPDSLTLDLKIDDKVLKDILAHLYYPLSPYAFNYIPADILGQVYERFLGKVIRLTPAHQAKVEEKPEVRKAGGVYYTPTYIVEYIVKNTVGELLKDQTPETLKTRPLRVLDPACGSGSFLLGAYQYLLDWYLDWYIQNDPGRWAKGKSPAVMEGLDGWQLTMDKKKEILLSHIYGVDIDAQAVEVTKLSLLLKVVEHPGQLNLFNEGRILPDLGRNIQCGNSLIGDDYFAGQQMGMFDLEEQYRVNPFDWQRAFPQVFPSPLQGGGREGGAGGFDAVIGNPPWGGDLTNGEKTYAMSKFSAVHMRTPDTFNYFILEAYRLTRKQGIVGMIIPNNFLFQHEYSKARRFYAENSCITKAINLGDNVFAVTAPSCIIFISNDRIKDYEISIVDLREIDREKLPNSLSINNLSKINVADILQSPDFIVPMDKSASIVISRIFGTIPTLLGDLCDEVAAGIGSGGDKAFRISDDDAKRERIEPDLLHPLLIGREMNAYYLPETTNYSIIYSTKAISHITHPNTLKHLSPYQGKLSQKRETKKGMIPWWSLHWPRYPGLFDAPKIVLRQTANSLYATIDRVGYYCLNSIIIVKPKSPDLILYYLGLLNSKLIRWLYGNLTQEQNRTFAEVKPINLRKLPIRIIDFSNSIDVKHHDRIVALVERMLELHKQLAAARLPQEKELLERQIHATDEQIDRLVYELYGLTEEEIRIVEGG